MWYSQKSHTNGCWRSPILWSSQLEVIFLQAWIRRSWIDQRPITLLPHSDNLWGIPLAVLCTVKHLHARSGVAVREYRLGSQAVSVQHDLGFQWALQVLAPFLTHKSLRDLGWQWLAGLVRRAVWCPEFLDGKFGAGGLYSLGLIDKEDRWECKYEWFHYLNYYINLIMKIDKIYHIL